jgi:hypothetical protein
MVGQQTTADFTLFCPNPSGFGKGMQQIRAQQPLEPTAPSVLVVSRFFDSVGRLVQ